MRSKKVLLFLVGDLGMVDCLRFVSVSQVSSSSRVVPLSKGNARKGDVLGRLKMRDFVALKRHLFLFDLFLAALNF